MKARYLKSSRNYLLLVALLFNGCTGYDSSSSQSENVVGSQNTTVVDNSVSGEGEAFAESPCEGALWKPVSEADGALVIVSSPGDVVPWSSVQVFHVRESGSIESEYCENAGLLPEGDRQAWRCSRPGEEYTGEFIIEARGESCTAVVREPGERND